MWATTIRAVYWVQSWWTTLAKRQRICVFKRYSIFKITRTGSMIAKETKYNHSGYRDTTNATGCNERFWKWWRHKNMFSKKMIYFRYIPYLLGWLFCITAGKRYYLLQIHSQRNLFMTNESKSIFFICQACFSNPSILLSILSDRYTSFVQMLLWFIYCCVYRAVIDAFLWASGSSLNPGMVRSLIFVRVHLSTGYDTP